MKMKINDVRVVCKDIRTLMDEQWRTLRRNLGGEPKLGCSDTSRVEGIYNASKEPFPWGTPAALSRELSAAMSGCLLENPSNNAMDWGHKMEELIARAWAAENPEWQLVETHVMYESTRYPWMRGNMDYLILHRKTGELGILEIKHTSMFNAAFIGAMRDGHVPEYYEWQCRAEMALLHLDTCILCLGWSKMEDGCGVEDIAWVKIEQDQQKEDFMIRAEKEFLEKVVSGTPITVTVSAKLAEELKEQWKDAVPGMASLPDETYPDIIRLKTLEGEKAELEERLAALEAEWDIIADRIYRCGNMRQNAELIRGDQRYTLEMLFTQKSLPDEDAIRQTYPALYDAACAFSMQRFKAQAKEAGIDKQRVEELVKKEAVPKGFALRIDPYSPPS